MTVEPTNLELLLLLALIAAIGLLVAVLLRLKDVKRLAADNEERVHYMSLAGESVFWKFDFSTDTIEWGEGFEKLYERKRDGGEGTTAFWESLLHQEDKPRVIDSLEMAAHSRQSLWSEEYRILTPTSTKYVLDRGIILRNDDGSPAKLLGAISDVTAQVAARETARAGERRFRDVVENLTDVFYNHSPHFGKMLYVNAMYETVWGKTVQSLYEEPTSFMDSVHPEDAHVLHEAFKLQMAGQRTEVEYRIVRPDGRVRWIRDQAAPLTAPDGSVSQIVGTARDITESKLATLGLIESERRLKEIGAQLQVKHQRMVEAQEVAKLGNWELDLVTGKIDWSPETYRIFGQDPASFTPGLDAIFQLLPEEGRDSLWREFERLLGVEGNHFLEHLLIGREGEVKHIELRFRSTLGANGAPLRAVGTIHDVTARKLHEAERDRLISAIEQVEEIVLITDRDGRAQYVNRAFENVTGFTREEILGRTPALMKSGRHDAQFYADFWSRISQGQTWKGTFTNRRKSGEVYQEDTVVSPVRDASGAIVNYVSIKRDNSERLKREEQLREAQKMEAVGLLAGGIAHDFNNMLTVILAQSQMALAGRVSEEKMPATLRLIHEAADRSADLTRQLLAFAQRREDPAGALNPREKLESIMPILRSLAGERIRFELSAADDVGNVRMGALGMHQIFTNLVLNARDAIQARDDGKPGLIGISIENVTHQACDPLVPGDYVRITVSDDGIGMDEQVRARVFEPFFTTKQVGAGTGLGLSVLHGIVTQAGGGIQLSSQPGEGACISLCLPRCEASAEHEAELPPAETPGDTPLRVLLVEDEPMVLETTAEMLEELGCRVTKTPCAMDALSIFKRDPQAFDLLLTDLVMPLMTGYDLAEKIRVTNPDTCILLMTGYDPGLAQDYPRRNLVDDLIQKPFTLDTLSRAISHVCPTRA